MDYDKRLGPIQIATTTHDIGKDRQIKINEISKVMGISKKLICHILIKDLWMKKLTAYLVPRLLTQDQNRTRMNIYKLKQFM